MTDGVRVIEFQNEADVMKYYKEKKKDVIIFEGSVYDVAEYKETHPGGPDLINDYLGKCIDEPFYDEGHSKAARKIFRDLPLIGYLAGAGDNQNDDDKKVQGMGGTTMESKFPIDLNGPLID